MLNPEEVPSEYDRQIGLRIKQARIGAGLTQKQLAGRIGVKQGTVSKLELGLLEEALRRKRPDSTDPGKDAESGLWGCRF